MKWRATFKWEAIAGFRHIRWVLVPALIILGVMTLLSLLMPASDAVWLLYIPIVLMGIYLLFYYPILFFDRYLKAYKLTERLSSRPLYVYAIVQFIYGTIVSVTGFLLMYLPAGMLFRMEMTEVILSNLFLAERIYDISYVLVTVFIVVIAVLAPAWDMVWVAARHSCYRRFSLLIAFVMGPFPIIFTILLFAGMGTHWDTLFSYGLGIAEITLLIVTVVFTAANVALASWLEGYKADFANKA